MAGESCFNTSEKNDMKDNRGRDETHTCDGSSKQVGHGGSAGTNDDTNRNYPTPEGDQGSGQGSSGASLNTYKNFPSTSTSAGSLQRPNNLTSAGSFQRPNNSTSAGSLQRPNNLTSAGSFQRPNNSTSAGSLQRPNNLTSAGSFQRPNNSTSAGSLQRPNNSTKSRAVGKDNSANKEKQNEIGTKYCYLLGKVMLGIIVLLFIIFRFPYNYYPKSCYMGKSENRDFNTFYGIENLQNHFATNTTSDDCTSNFKFTSALPQLILTSYQGARSFMILGEYGTGKTLLRCEYFKTLSSDRYLKILILNKEITDYVERFIAKREWNSQLCTRHNCLVDWSDNEFAQLLLSALVTTFIENYSEKEMKFTDIPIDRKINLVTIICYYYNGDNISQLEDFVNSFLGKKKWSLYKASEAEVQVKERNVFQEKPLLTHLKNDLNEFSVLNTNVEKLHLLLVIIEGEGFEYQSIQKIMFGHVLRDLTDFSSFITKYMKKVTVFIIDGIDENQYLSLNNEANKISFESFYRSSVSENILSLTMANYFYLSIFYPKMGDINILDAIARPDKFPIYTLNWNTKSLINYADYVLQELNKNALSTRCKSLTDFKTLVNYNDNRIAEIIDRIQTPRELHLFMMELIKQMNRDANNTKRPFIATYENVHNAFEKSPGHSYKYDKVKG